MFFKKTTGKQKSFRFNDGMNDQMGINADQMGINTDTNTDKIGQLSLSLTANNNNNDHQMSLAAAAAVRCYKDLSCQKYTCSNLTTITPTLASYRNCRNH